MAKHPKNALKWGFFSKIHRQTHKFLIFESETAKHGFENRLSATLGQIDRLFLCYLGMDLQACSHLPGCKKKPVLFGGME